MQLSFKEIAGPNQRCYHPTLGPEGIWSKDFEAEWEELFELFRVPTVTTPMNIEF
jgi:hypothetical protein